MDNDDVIEENYLQELHALALEHNADIVACGDNFYDFDSNKLLMSRSLSYTPTGYELLDRFAMTCTTAKLYSVSFLRRNNITFAGIRYFEDVFFNYLALPLADKVIYTNKVFYSHLCRKTSQSNTLWKQFKNSPDFLMYEERIKEVLTKRPYYSQVFEYYYFYTFICFMLTSGRKTSLNVFTRVFDEGINSYKSLFPKFYDNPYLHIFTPKVFPLHARLAVWLGIKLERIGLLKYTLMLYTRF